MTRKLKIAAICAPTRGPNAGMVTVDSALLSLVEKNFPQASVNLFNVERAYSLLRDGKPQINYSLLTEAAQLADFDRVLIWGDFTLARRYHETGLRARTKRGVSDDEAAARLTAARDLLLMRNVPDAFLGRVLCIGGSIYTNSLYDTRDEAYRAAIGRLYGHARLVMKRDPISAEYAYQYGRRADPTNGVDCAFLLEPFSLLNWKKTPDRSKGLRIGYSFGRGLTDMPSGRKKLLAFVDKLEQALGGEKGNLVDLDWLNLRRTRALEGLEEKLTVLNSCDVMVTDTYHCAINSWREGVPAICVGLGAQHPSTALSEKKKEILYSLFNIREYYVFYEDIMSSSGSQKFAAAAAKILQDDKKLKAALGQISDVRTMAKERLIAALAPE